MPDTDASRVAVRLLGTVIAEILEDTAPLALKPGAHGPQRLAAKLLEAGQDVTTLALAIGVLTRRGSEV